MGDAEGVHDLLAGLLLVIEDQRHDRRDPLRQRRIGGAHQLLVVLDEIHAGLHQLADQRRRLMRAQAERRLDDGADDRPVITRPSGGGCLARPNCGPGCAPWNSAGSFMSMTRRPVSPLIANAPPMAIVISAERSVPTASKGKAMSTSARRKGPGWPDSFGPGGRRGRLKPADRGDARGDTRFQLLRFARHGHERSARLVGRRFSPPWPRYCRPASRCGR